MPLQIQTPKIEYVTANEPNPLRLHSSSEAYGWVMFEHGNAIVAVLSDGAPGLEGCPTVTVNCADWAAGSTVIATVTLYAPNPTIYMGHDRITIINDDYGIDVAAAYNNAINKAWALFDHIYK